MHQYSHIHTYNTLYYLHMCKYTHTSVRAAVCASPHDMYLTFCVLRVTSSVGSGVSVRGGR